jgi:hypothetical protein
MPAVFWYVVLIKALNGFVPSLDKISPPVYTGFE